MTDRRVLSLQIAQSLRHLLRDVQHLLRSRRPVRLYPLTQGDPANVFHDQKDAFLCLKDINDLRKVRHPQTFHHLQFMADTGLIGSLVHPDLFYGPEHLCLQVNREEYASFPAFPQTPDKFVFPSKDLSLFHAVPPSRSGSAFTKKETHAM